MSDARRPPSPLYSASHPAHPPTRKRALNRIDTQNVDQSGTPIDGSKNVNFVWDEANYSPTSPRNAFNSQHQQYNSMNGDADEHEVLDSSTIHHDSSPNTSRPHHSFVSDHVGVSTSRQQVPLDHVESPILSGRKMSRGWPSNARSPSIYQTLNASVSTSGETSPTLTRAGSPPGPLRSTGFSPIKEKNRRRDSSPRRHRWRAKTEGYGDQRWPYRIAHNVLDLFRQRSDTYSGTLRIPFLHGSNNTRLLRLIILLGLFVVAALYWQGKISLGRSKKPPVLRDIYRANAARREAQLRFTNPSIIPYSELFQLNSTFEENSPEQATVAVLFLPSQDVTSSGLERAYASLQKQSQPPAAFSIAPSSQFLAPSDQDIPVGYPSPEASHFTLVLPISSSTSSVELHFGEKTLHYLAHVASTREFAGSILEIGCAQAIFVQTSWISSLSLGVSTATNSVSWKHKGLSQIRLPLVGLREGVDDFWVENLVGIADCPHQQSAQTANAAYQSSKAEAESIKFFIEGVNAFEQRWKELVCEFASRPRDWRTVIFLLGQSRSDTTLICDGSLSLRAKTITLADFNQQINPEDLVLYAKHTAIARQLATLPQSGATIITLPQDDIRYSTWMVSLPLEALKAWHKPQFDITVITNNRPHSVARLLTSLKTAHYYGDAVHLSINLEQTADAETKQLTQNFRWSHGGLSLRHRIILGGLMPAIVESWYPTSNHTYGVILEDDIEVSPLFYAWLKFAILHYRYTASGRQSSQRLFGVSLYSPKNVELRPEGRQPFDARNLFHELNLPVNTPYLSQVPCSWGAAYFPEIWREYHQYLGLRLGETSLELSETIVPDVRSNRWPRSWKKYFIELVYARGYTMLYPNYENFASFSNNHLEMGTHIHVVQVDLKKKMQFEVPLMTESQCPMLLDLPNGVLPDWDNLPVIDLWGSVVTEEEIIARGSQTMTTLALCAPADSPQPYDISRAPTYDPLELLCPVDFAPTLELNATELLGGVPTVDDALQVLPVKDERIMKLGQE